MLGWAWFAAGCVGVSAQSQPEPADFVPPPPFQYLRHDEDYGYLSDPARRTGEFNRLKYIPLGRDRADWYLSFGGEVRPRYEFYRNDDWGREARNGDGYFVNRVMFHADMHLGRRVRFFAHLKSGIEAGRRGEPRPIDKDDLDLHEAFVDFNFGDERSGSFVVRGGRQEISFNPPQRRFLSAGEGRNVRRSFDGVSLIWRKQGWRVHGFASKLVQLREGFFDDPSDSSLTFWGVDSETTGLPLPRASIVNFSYFGIDRKRIIYDQGAGREIRHTVAANFRNKGAGAADNELTWDYDWQFAHQFGRFGRGSIGAWTAATDTGYTFRRTLFAPRAGLQFNAASGDRDPADAGLQTFDPLFPRGAYFGNVRLIALLNVFDLRPTLDLALTKKIEVSIENGCFWRFSTRDGVYSSGGDLARTGQQSRARFIGDQLTVTASWNINRHWTHQTIYTRFFVGRFLRETPPARNTDFFRSSLTFKF